MLTIVFEKKVIEGNRKHKSTFFHLLSGIISLTQSAKKVTMSTPVEGMQAHEIKSPDQLTNALNSVKDKLVSLQTQAQAMLDNPAAAQVDAIQKAIKDAELALADAAQLHALFSEMTKIDYLLHSDPNLSAAFQAMNQARSNAERTNKALLALVVEKRGPASLAEAAAVVKNTIDSLKAEAPTNPMFAKVASALEAIQYQIDHQVPPVAAEAVATTEPKEKSSKVKNAMQTLDYWKENAARRAGRVAKATRVANIRLDKDSRTEVRERVDAYAAVSKLFGNLEFKSIKHEVKLRELISGLERGKTLAGYDEDAQAELKIIANIVAKLTGGQPKPGFEVVAGPDQEAVNKALAIFEKSKRDGAHTMDEDERANAKDYFMKNEVVKKALVIAGAGTAAPAAGAPTSAPDAHGHSAPAGAPDAHHANPAGNPPANPPEAPKPPEAAPVAEKAKQELGKVYEGVMAKVAGDAAFLSETNWDTLKTPMTGVLLKAAITVIEKIVGGTAVDAQLQVVSKPDFANNLRLLMILSTNPALFDREALPEVKEHFATVGELTAFVNKLSSIVSKPVSTP